MDFYDKNFGKIKKINIKETFGFYRKLKDGSEGKIFLFPEIEEIHSSDEHIGKWVEYSCFDAEITFFLRETLSKQLSRMKTKEENMGDMCTLYAKYWLPFGELLTDMERIGFKVDTNYLRKIQLQAEKDKKEYEETFL